MPRRRRAATLAYLRERELVSYAYDEARLPVRLDGGGEVEALAFVSNRAHPQYRGGLSLEEQAEVIARAVGPRGPNADYLLNTVDEPRGARPARPRPAPPGRAGARPRPAQGVIGRGAPLHRDLLHFARYQRR